MISPIAQAATNRKRHGWLLSAFFGVVEIPDHHFFKGLIPPTDPCFWIGVVQIGLRVIERRFAGDPRPSGQLHGRLQAVFGLPVEIVVGDIMTCKLRVDYFNLKDGEKSGYVHSKHYPYLKRDNWFLIITDETFTGLAAVEKISIT